MRQSKSLVQWGHRRVFAILSLVLLGGGLWSISTARDGKKRTTKILSQQEVSPGIPTEVPQIIIRKNPGSPIQVKVVSTDKLTINSPEFIVRLINRGGKPIRAYAIRYETVSKTSKAGGTELVNSQSTNSILLPNNFKEIDIGTGTEYSDSIERIYVSVDFVEFTDGRRWGSDYDKSADRLDGQRAGADAARGLLLSLLSSKGVTTVMNSLDDLDMSPPHHASKEFTSGFRLGIGMIKARLKNNYKNGGEEEIESLIRKPYDASQQVH